MIQAHSHTFQFTTQEETKEGEKKLNNIISIVEEDYKKHHISYIQYHHIDEHNINSRQVTLHLDRLYFLEVANIAINNEERRERLFTLIGKRCFGLNDNKIDAYLLDKECNVESVYEHIEENDIKNTQQPILYELITHNTNKYEAYSFCFEQRCFVSLKQTNISNRKTFEKTFLVQLTNAQYEKLLRYSTNELKIEFIFHAIGKIHFFTTPLTQNYFPQQDPNPDEIIKKTFETLESSTAKRNLKIDKKAYKKLQKFQSELEVHYFDILSKGMTLLEDPLDVDNSYLLADAFSKFAKLLENENSFSEIVSFLKTIKIFIQDGKISYLLHKKDSDIKDISQYVLETFTAFNASLEQDNLQNFIARSLDLYHALKYYIKVYLRIYSEYKVSDAAAKPKKKKKKKKEEIELPVYNKTSAQDFLKDTIGLDDATAEELYELDDEIKNALCNTTLDDKSRYICIDFLEGYSKVLNTYYEFKELSYSISILTLELSRYNIEDKSNKLLVVLLNKLIDDLIEWKEAVFIHQNAEDINYIDNTFYANVAQMDILINDHEYDNAEEIKVF